MTIEEVKNKATFVCEHVDPSGKPINGYYDIKEDIYYITYDSEVTRDKTEYVTFKKGSDIKDNLLFDPFSELKIINGK
ncbi:hypothetical protein [Sulfurimonas sp.]|jgi:hypothetical protein|uniref:hypothetical protein n=1 Tax=Sulfurimonas sp. TaxID=2022749 RepID=UPI0025D129A7|nr:hypothetical protein [Sulfurimonas sp.]MBT5934605.1 hypothetical protein [Sulfurimonas sp.]